MATRLRVGFAGTPPFAAAALDAILTAGFSVPVVLTQPDRAQGRGLKRVAGAVKELASLRGIAVLQPASLKDAAARAQITAMALDVLIVAAYGLILPQPILDWPTHGCINIHASLLPRWRGAAPIQRALLAGDAETGVSIMRMDAGLDTGPLIATRAVSIARRETAGTLHDKLATAGARAIVEALERLERDGWLDTTPQPSTGASYAAKIGRDEEMIDWGASAIAIDRRVRAFNPSPGATTTLDGQRLKIWDALPAPGSFGAAGRVLRADAAGIVVACGEGALIVRELQRAGGKSLSAASFLAGHRLAAGTALGA